MGSKRPTTKLATMHACIDAYSTQSKGMHASRRRGRIDGSKTKLIENDEGNRRKSNLSSIRPFR
eukprot:scaffold100_cov323-Pavlova_lutheri.AAC.39